MRILIVDDDERVRDALTLFFDTRDDFVVVGEAANGAEAIARCRQLQPDLILLDLNMPIMDGLAATHRIHEEFPRMAVVILTNSVNWERIEAALQAGASAYVLKSANTEKLAHTLRAARRSHAPPLRVPQLFNRKEA
jgi:DNA-binding NarL/FixJ family response regulator